MPNKAAGGSALRDAVHQRIERSGLSVKEAARMTGVSETSLRNLGDQSLGPQDATLHSLTALGFSFDELARLRTADITARYGGTEDWSPDIMQVAIRMTRMTPGRRRLLLAMAELIRDFDESVATD